VHLRPVTDTGSTPAAGFGAKTGRVLVPYRVQHTRGSRGMMNLRGHRHMPRRPRSPPVSEAHEFRAQ